MTYSRYGSLKVEPGLKPCLYECINCPPGRRYDEDRIYVLDGRLLCGPHLLARLKRAA
jgi:hypothetical protein